MSDLKQELASAARVKTVFDAALNYVSLGISVLPCREKKPALLEWKLYQQRPPNLYDLFKWEDARLLQNVGIICGKVSQNLVVIDLDGEAAVDAFTQKFPHLLDTYTVLTGSGIGRHVYLFCDSLPASTRVTGTDIGNVELRANGCYVLAPPSVHPDTGRAYLPENRKLVLEVASLHDVVTWIKDLTHQAHGGVQPPPLPPGRDARAQNVWRWALAAMAGETTAVRAALPGAQNNTLNLAAFKLGQIVGAGLLDRHNVETELYAAARALIERDGEQSVRNTIKSGLDAGVRNPRKVSA